MHKKLFIPGPTEVRDEILQAMATPMIGHRSSAYAELHKSLKRKCKSSSVTQAAGVPVHLLVHGRHGRRNPQLRREEGAQHPQWRVLPALVRDRQDQRRADRHGRGRARQGGHAGTGGCQRWPRAGSTPCA